MTHYVSALFEDAAHVERALGALHAEGFDDTSITITAPGAQVETAAPPPLAMESHGLGHWLSEHLPLHGGGRPQRTRAVVVSGPQVVSLRVVTAGEEQDARTLLVGTGAVEISSPVDGTMRRITPTPSHP